ncbi:polyprenyl synthetase [Clostridium sp. CAG:557]|nr:polyprenyl synthetase [Clostridium sp. CAG:557]
MRNIDDYLALINDNLGKYLPGKDILQKSVIDAMEYSLAAGGKRVRPILTLAFCEACGGYVENALPFACAVEMVHTYSLIHDDLPCMDNDFLRRGRPANHIANGEAMALLAGDALLTRAFEVMLCDETIKLVGAEAAAMAAGCLARSIGVLGMIGGQVIDLESEGKNLTQVALDKMHSLKTGALITAAAKIGCIAAQANKNEILAAQSYANSIGLAFQIMDDILDVTSTSDELGKNVGSDLAAQKSTYVSCMGIEKSKRTVLQLTENAIKSLKVFGDKKEFLQIFAQDLSKRKR